MSIFCICHSLANKVVYVCVLRRSMYLHLQYHDFFISVMRASPVDTPSYNDQRLIEFSDQ